MTDEKKLNLSFKNTPLPQVLKEIKRQTLYDFMYNAQEIDIDQRISIELKNVTLDSALRVCLAPFHLTYVIKDKIIILKKKEAMSHLAKHNISGIVKDEQGVPLPGVAVILQGTTAGTVTNSDGRFQITIPQEKCILNFTFIGMKPVHREINGEQFVTIVMEEDIAELDEVVVTGMETIKKDYMTGSASVITAKDLRSQGITSIDRLLEGAIAGLNSTTLSGAPGTRSKITIRGENNLSGRTEPLWIVDGLPLMSGVPENNTGDYAGTIMQDGVGNIMPEDIESITILKDASAAAIYGAKAANGVIVITTKQGKKNDRVQVSYNGYFGVAKMANDGYGLLNAWEAMEFQEEGQRNLFNYRGGQTVNHAQFGSIGKDGTGHLTMPYAIKPAGYSKEQIISQYGSIAAWEASYKDNGENTWSRSAYYQMLEDGYSEEEARAGTNWYDEVVQTGKVQDHQISITGGGEKATYSVGLGYMNREGTIKESWFRRYSLRANTNFFVNKWFNIGQNTNIAVIENSGERGRQGDDNTFGKTFSIQPWVPIYTVGGDYSGSQNAEGGRAESAPMSVDYGKDNRRRFLRAQSAIYAEIMPLESLGENLKIRTQFSARLGGAWDFWMNKRTIMTNKEGRNNNEFYEQANYWLDYQWTNTATYSKTINDDHTINAVIGTEALREGLGRWIQAGRINYPFEDDPNTWVINNGASSDLRNSGNQNAVSTMFGMFARADYAYQGKYLATVTVRRDASSRFSEKNRWGTFPSISLGWRMSDEKFMEKSRTWLDDLKIRAGYGTTGNSNIDSYNWAFQYGTGNRYLYSINGSDTEVYQGFGVTNLGDIEAKWETSKMFNAGFDITAFNQRLTANFDYYIKKTSDMLIDANWSALAGAADKPKVNIGDMTNKGVDLNITWNDKIGEVGYSVGVNLSHYKNRLDEIGTDAGIFTGTRISNMNVLMKGHAIGEFHGYQLDGIYKSEEEVRNYKNDAGGTVLPYGTSDASTLNAANYVGQFKVKDVNNDGKIDASDRTFIGNPHPDLTGGINLGVNWKGFDLSTYMYFSVGNDLFAMYKYYTHYGSLQSAYSKDRRDNSWHPVTNPDGIYPMWATANGESTIAANESNSGYIEDGSFLRMQTLTLGYTLPKSILDKIKFEKIRIYGQIANVFTLTGYSGLDPQVRTDTDGRSNDRTMGTDFGSYGMPRQFIMGVNVTF